MHTKKENNQTKIIAVVALAVILVLGIFLRPVTVGQAQYYVPNPVNLDINPIEEITFEVDTWDTVIFTPSGSSTANTYNILLDKSTDGFYKYVIKEDNWVRASGLLNQNLISSGNIYLDEDTIPDLKVSLTDDDFLMIRNVVEKDYSNIKLLTSHSGNIFDVKAGDLLELQFEVTSHEPPEIEAFVGETALTYDEFYEIEYLESTKTSVMNLSYTIPESFETSMLKIVSTTITSGDTVKKYILAVDGVLYALTEQNYPSMYVKKVPAGHEVIYTFEPTRYKQAFSLPCGSVDIASLPVDQIESIITYDSNSKEILGWNAIAADLTKLNVKSGYLLKLKTAEEFSFNYTCPTTVPPQEKFIPTLVKGWNLVSVGLIDPIKLTELGSYNKIYSIDNIGVFTDDLLFELEPGKAYWVNVE
jgi:hypothetical protein